MRAFTISGMRIGATKEQAAAQTMAMATAAQAQAQAMAADATWSGSPLAPGYWYAPADVTFPSDVGASSGSKTPLIIGGIAVAVLGIGGYFLLRKKGKR